MLLALKLTPSEAELTALLERFFTTVPPGAWCEAQGNALNFKRGKFRGNNGDSIETFRAYTYDSWGGIQLRGMQQLVVRDGREKSIESILARADELKPKN